MQTNPPQQAHIYSGAVPMVAASKLDRLARLLNSSAFIFTTLVASFIAAGVCVADTFCPCGECQTCPQCRWVEETVMKTVVSHRCRMVPAKKEVKKTIYECKEIPFCLHKLPCLHHGDCDCACADCEACPRYKKVLLKKEVVDHVICGAKCEVEEIVTQVPCTVRRCIPCNVHYNCAPATGAPQAPPAPIGRKR